MSQTQQRAKVCFEDGSTGTQATLKGTVCGNNDCLAALLEDLEDVTGHKLTLRMENGMTTASLIGDHYQITRVRT